TNVRTARPDEVPADLAFAAIWSNPPIRIGKPAVQELLGTWLPRLTQGADAHLVIGKNLGADGYARWITDELGLPTERAATSKGFRVLRTSRPAGG
ncbi:16S rRNA methyltransferase, partial [Janibacter sp. RAF20_2_2]